MPASQHSRSRSLHLDIASDQLDDAPPITALFLVTFDAHAGYTISWQRSIPSLQLNDSVEFKSLPSGLHNVAEDLVYFAHGDEDMGISAFINRPSPTSQRNALTLAVGALTRAKSWMHAQALKELAQRVSSDPTITQPLEQFWHAHGLQTQDSPDIAVEESPSVREGQDQSSTLPKRRRAVSSASAIGHPDTALPIHHPARSLPQFLDTFGPLVFPLYKAALLRKRILFLHHAPVETACNFVYDLALLSGLPSSVISLLPLDPLPTRIHTLFSVGIHDMPVLAGGARLRTPATDEGYGWVACSTDNVLLQKHDLYDYIVDIRGCLEPQAEKRSWPRIMDSRGREIKATQRDLRRFQTLSNSLGSLDEGQGKTIFALDAGPELVEPQSWSAVVYNGFMFWAGAGENRTDVEEEEEHDAALLRHLDAPKSPDQAQCNVKSPDMDDRSGGGPLEMQMTTIAFFHRLTTLILQTLADIVDSGDDGSLDGVSELSNEHAEDRVGMQNESDPLIPTNDEEDQTKIVVEPDDMVRMGLDTWSAGDRSFIRELLSFYWGRDSVVKRGSVECCGVRIC